MKFKFNQNYLFITVCAIVIVFLFSCKTQLPSEITPYTNSQITSEYTSDSIINLTIHPYKNTLDVSMNEVLAYNPQRLDDTGYSTSLGNLLAQMVQEYADSYCKNTHENSIDFVLLNHGGMRINLDKGPITVRTIYELMPFENELVIIDLSPQKMQEMIAYFENGPKGHPMSKILIDLSQQPTQVSIKGAPLDPNQTYRVATHDYLMKGGDGMNFLKDNPTINTQIKLRDIFIEKAKEYKELPLITTTHLIVPHE